MSKRFGRNQKRAMRAEIALNYGALVLATRKAGDLEDNNHRLRKETRGLTANLQVALSAIEEARTILGEYFHGLPPRVIEQAHIPESVMLPHRGRLYGVADQASDLIAAANMAERLETIDGGAWLDDLTLGMHVSFKTPLGNVAYAFNPRTFQGQPKHRVVRHLADEMANHLWHSAEANGLLTKAGVKP
jgi:hypothetical protein